MSTISMNRPAQSPARPFFIAPRSCAREETFQGNDYPLEYYKDLTLACCSAPAPLAHALSVSLRMGFFNARRIILSDTVIVEACATPKSTPKWDNTMFRLTPPTHAIFYISVALAIISVLLRLMVVSGHAILPTGGYVIRLIGYLALLASVTFKGV